MVSRATAFWVGQLWQCWVCDDVGDVQSCCSQVASELSYSATWAMLSRPVSEKLSVSRGINRPFVQLWQCCELLQLIVRSAFSMSAATPTWGGGGMLFFGPGECCIAVYCRWCTLGGREGGRWLSPTVVFSLFLAQHHIWKQPWMALLDTFTANLWEASWCSPGVSARQGNIVHEELS